ncbi:MAG: class I SAM-dependent methyltransferase, partial [Rhodospirillaceae bacterium]|nr:class I SAM-dependent methyltransferase [Rhodospirillaceae bacterium]
GCGPGPALAKLFEEAGHSMALYDPYYAPDTSVLLHSYDFITMSEVVEHLAEPGKVLDDLWANLNAGSWLGIMTKRVRNAEAFKAWHYITDPTHICYFSVSTFQWLAKRWSAKLIISGDDVVLMQKG